MIILKKVEGKAALFLIAILLFSGNLSARSKNRKFAINCSGDFGLNQDGKPKRMWVAIPDRFGRPFKNE
jgi:hypothetical protein